MSTKFNRRDLLRMANGLAICSTAKGALGPAKTRRSAQIIDCCMSSGDNLARPRKPPIDSKASIEATFDLLRDLGVRRLYWRGLEIAIMVEVVRERPENLAYLSLWKWIRQVYKKFDLDRLAVEAAHKRGMEIWGVGTLVDWGCPADAPGFNDYPWTYATQMRLDHPEWIPVDRSGLLKQGGPLVFAYPEARRALIDLHMKYMRRDGYDGMVLITYAENFSMRFQDEFGFNDPIVAEFKRRTGVDLRTQPFSPSASREDWYALRGEYVTMYLRELKQELKQEGKKLGLYLNPYWSHFTQAWNVPDTMMTAGHIYLDLDTWVREGIVDQFVVYNGRCSPRLQARTVREVAWLTHKTPVSTSLRTSTPFAKKWKSFRQDGMYVTFDGDGKDVAYDLENSNIPEQPLSALNGPGDVLRLRVLAQIVRGRTTATVADLVPLTKSSNPIIRRMVLIALGKIKDPQGVPPIEAGLQDHENCVRCMAAAALADVNGPDSFDKLISAVDRSATYQLVVSVVETLPKLRPLPRNRLIEAAQHTNPQVRLTAIQALGLIPESNLVPTFGKALHDSDRYVRFSAAVALGDVPHSTEALRLLVEATRDEDPVISDRAATSLAKAASRKEKEFDALRPRVLACLKELYSKFGSNCQRVDAGWGYRPVGNALLKMGADGERILQQFLDQREDMQLAEFAWKTLWIRQDNGTFSRVCEEENAIASQHCPLPGKHFVGSQLSLLALRDKYW
ncbi:MAG TPA: HEAT repeat domain-containing protein [Terriglobia bacterium]|nr:HEAT repeat domain-containing protein [Terriglobia bacterium]